MEILEPYIGKYVSAKSASDDIDITSIISGCNIAISASSGFKTIGQKYEEAAKICDSKALSVDSFSMEESILSDGELISSYQQLITSLMQTIIDNSISAYNNLQQKYNDAAEAKDLATIKSITNGVKL